MAEDDSGEKSNEPTPRKKEKAREEGKVVTSKEMFVFACIATGTLLLAMVQSMSTTVGGMWSNYFVIRSGTDLDQHLLIMLGQAWKHVLVVGLMAAVPIGLVVLGLQAAMGGIQFAPKALGFKPEKLDPLKGLARMVSKQALVELVKGILKVSMLAVVAGYLLYGMLPRLDRLWATDVATSLNVVLSDTVLMLGGLSVVLLVIGAIDLIWQMYSMKQQLMMTFKEVRDEAKETNGSPELKGKIRQKQFEMSRRGAQERAALKDVPKATAIVTNPTHFAIALRYVPGEMPAPVVLASGKGHMAHEIIKLGKKKGIHTVRVPLLARALYFTTQIGQEIDERLFTAVAVLLGYVYHVDRGYMGEMPDIDLPDELHLNEFGRRMDEE